MLNNIFDHPSAPLPSQEGGKEIALVGHPSIDSGQAWPGRGDKLDLGDTPKPLAVPTIGTVLPFSRSLLNGLLALCC